VWEGIQADVFEANSAYDRAVATHSAALLIAGELQASTDNTAIVLGRDNFSGNAKQLTEDYSNLASLSHLTEHYHCEHCRSVLGPAAYLVELLEFLDRRELVGRTQEPWTKKRPKEVLFDRRPDLFDLDLNCANAETLAQKYTNVQLSMDDQRDHVSLLPCLPVGLPHGETSRALLPARTGFYGYVHELWLLGQPQERSAKCIPAFT
jgi:hypothetical protein